MASKAEMYAQMADQAAVQVTKSWQEWTAFLTTASRLYKYPYHEQLMIYAQRPDATACAEYDLWNKRMGRYIKRGSRGIALVDDSGDRPRLRYVFDVSDTGEREQSRRPYLWVMQPDYAGRVMDMIEQRYGVPALGDLVQQLADLAGRLTEDYWLDNRRDILRIVDGSFLEEYDEFNIGLQFKSAATVSITYSLMSRCGLEPGEYFDHEDFMAIFDFNTPGTVAALGTAVSQINQQILRQIGVLIQNIEREKAAERSRAYGEQTDLHTERGLSDPGFEAAGRTAEAAGQVRQDAENLPEGAQAGPVQPAPPVRETVPAPAGDGRGSEQPSGADDAGADGSGRGNGAAQGQRHDAVGRVDEQLQGPGGGDYPEGTYQQLTLNLFPTEEEQIQRIEESGIQQMPGSFSVSDAEIDAELKEGSGFQGSKIRIYALYQHQPDAKTVIAFLKEEYGPYYGHSYTYPDGKKGEVHFTGKGVEFSKWGYEKTVKVKWPELEKRLRQMVTDGTYLSGEEKIDYEQLELKYIGTVGGVPMPVAQFGFPSIEPIQEQAVKPEQTQESSVSGDVVDTGEPAHPGEAIEGAISVVPPVEAAKPLVQPRPETLQDAIDAAIQEWNGDAQSKRAVARYMKDHAREKDTAAWLRGEYGDGLPVFPVTGDGVAADIPWPKVQRRIAQLIKTDRFFTQEELDRLEEIDPADVREQLAEAGIENREVVHPELLGGSPFIRQAAADAEKAAQGEEKAPFNLSGQPISRTGDTVSVGGGNLSHEIDIMVTDEQWEAIQQALPEAEPVQGEMVPSYQTGDTVYLDGIAFEITAIREREVELRDPSLLYPIFRVENKENFERMLRLDGRNTAFFQAADLQQPVYLEGKPSYQTGDSVFVVYGERTISGTVGYIGDIDVRVDTGPYSWSNEVINRIQFEEGLRRDGRNASLFIPEQDGTVQQGEKASPAEGILEKPEPESTAGTTPEMVAETTTIYPGDKNHLPYDIVAERLHIGEPDPPEREGATADSRSDGREGVVTGSRPDGGKGAATDSRLDGKESEPGSHISTENFHITDENLGVGGPKAKFRANLDAIYLLKALELSGRTATTEEQETLSRYVGWGGLADAFDGDKREWIGEYKELQAALTPEEYESARASTLNAHYTSPAVIRAVYEAVGKMGFTAGNILEPSCGVGNFFGMLPEEMSGSRLYGVELDFISGRIAKQLYPKAEITVAGFETTDRRDFYDLAVGNVPFGQYQVNDPAYNRLGFSIHNYFFAKALDQVRPGGIVAFVTSRYTMDAKNPQARNYLAQRAEFLGAIRLPNNAFRANADTDVVSDIIFLQKRDRPIDLSPDWVHLGINEDGFAINSYFIDHPEMILGRQTSESTQYGRQDFTVEPIEGLKLSDQLHDAVKYIRGTYQEAELPDFGEGGEIDTSIPADPNVKNYSYTVVDGKVYFRENSRMVRPDLNATAEARIKGMVALRDCVQQFISLEMDEYAPDTAIREKQVELNRLYDSFSAKYGLINDRGNRLAFSDDSSYYLLCALEVLDEDGKLERKADMFTKRTIKPHRAVTAVDTASEALAVSIAERARVDMEYMSQLTGKSIPEIQKELTGVIFKDPAYRDDPLSGWQTADEYLSGNVRRKLRAAQRAAQADPVYAVNVEALLAAQPKDLDASEIEVRLGATWIAPEYIQQFAYEVLKTPRHLRGVIEIKYAAFTAEWQVTEKNSVGHNDVAAYTTYGTDRANAYRILEDSLNLRDVRIYDTVEDEDGKKRRVLNAKETTLAAQKQQALREAFKSWIWKDPERRQALVRQYNEEMNSTRPREYDGSHLVFAGMNPEITLREHQKNAIAHVLYGGNTLLAHEVGAGKTFEMVAAAMEGKRLGLCQKSIFVVPNHLTEQWASEFLRLYPSANILVTTKKDFETHNRKKFCARIATGDYDAVIIGHSQFERIPISRERQERLLREQIAEITAGIAEVEDSGGERFTVKQLERTKRNLELRLAKLQADGRKDDVVTFEQLGVDRMFVDEAHSYKNMFLYTKMRNVAGLSTTDAQKSSDMFAKCRYLDEVTGSRGVVFATGTPVSNSMTELYTMQRYLQYGRLQEMGMVHFDCWASRFGETTTALELAPEGTGYRARTRFAKFFNLPELMNLFKEVADIKTADQLHLPTPEVEYHTIVAKPTSHQQEMVQALSERAARVHSGSVDPSEDNMLKITTDGRKLGLDQRIISPLLPDEAGTKVNQCVANILQIWQDGQEEKLTQLVFCDISTPKAAPSKKAAKTVTGNLDNPELHALETAIPLPEQEAEFTIYEDIRQKLIAHGIPAEQIAFIHEANTEVRKKELFAKVRSGQVRVLMGSTSKMGAGTNVQDRLVALHDLDCPWRPGDLAQRKGRIERQGNQNPLVHVFRYVTEGTFDAYLWQTVENKQKFISQIMTSKSPVRACDDVDETALSFAEIKALCAGDPRIKERMDLDVEVSRLKLMKADHQSQQFRMEDNLLKFFPEQIEKCRGYIRGFEMDLQTLEQHPHPENGFAGMTVRGDVLTDKENAGAALLDACREVTDGIPVQVGSYRGFAIFACFNAFKAQYEVTLRGEMSHSAILGTDPRGNLTRLDNALAQMPQRLASVQAQLENYCQQRDAAKAEVGKPFPQEEELQIKSARLLQLDMELNMDRRTGARAGRAAVAKSERPSVLEKLREPVQRGMPDKDHKKKEMEVR